MPYLTTGLIDNTGTGSVRQSSRLSIELANEDTSTVVIQIEGFLKCGATRVKFADEFFTLTAGTMASRDYYILFDAFEFQFFVSSQAVKVFIWGKDVAENLTAVYEVFQ
jgi:hypothetical protein